MSDERDRYLGIYLNDHLAGATVGVERARALRSSEAGTEFAAPAARLCEEIEADKATLEALMDSLGVRRDPLKPALGWTGEKLGRLKPNGHWRGRSPLGRVIDLEVLAVGINGKLRLWKLLGQLVGERVATDFETLAARAEAQRSEVEELQSRAAALL